MPATNVQSYSLRMANSLLGRQGQKQPSQQTRQSQLKSDDVDQPAGSDLDDNTKLDLALKAIDEAKKQVTGEPITSLAHPAIQQMAAKTNQVVATPVSGKERAAAVSPDARVVDAVSDQSVEVEKSPEISPEVSEYVQRVEDHADQLAEPIVIDGKQLSTQPHHPTQPVVVLPISMADEKKARFKGVKFSIRWLIEFSHKIVKEFVGSVIYRQDENTSDQ